MSAQQSPSGKRKVWWLFLPFIIIGVLILISKNPFNFGKVQFSKSTNSEVPTKFTPEEFANMANNFSVDHVAGECTSKGFVEFIENGWTLEDGKKYNVYAYYYGDKITKKTKSSYEGSYTSKNRIEDMAERITPIGDLGFIHFSITNKENYEKFIEYIKSHSTEKIPTEKQLYSYPNYVFNNAVFIDCNYLRGFSAYCVYIYPLSKFASNNVADTAKAPPKADSTNNTSPEKILVIKVDEAEFYDAPNKYDRGVTKVQKGQRVKVYETQGEFTLCEYTNDAGLTTKKWLLNSDLALPATTNSESPQNSSSSSSTAFNGLKGLWKGKYEDNNISFVIEELSDNSLVKGYSSVKGNFDLFSGSVTSSGSGYSLSLEESKDNGQKGKFNLTYNNSTQSISGQWTAYDGRKSVSFTLSRVSKGNLVKVIADKAVQYREPEYGTSTGDVLLLGNTMTIDSINKQFIHCTYHIGSVEKSGWFLITKVEFL